MLHHFASDSCGSGEPAVCQSAISVPNKSAVRGVSGKGPQTGTGASNSLCPPINWCNDAKAIEEQVPSVLEVAPDR